MNPSVHYDKEMGGFILAANTPLALSRMELEVQDAVATAKNQTWKKKEKTTSGGGPTHTTNTNMFAGLSDDSSSDEE